MTCPKCGEESNPEGVGFCQQCGARLDVDTSTSARLEQNLAAILSYAVGWLGGLVLLFVEKKNDFVRYHAMQSIVTFVPITIVLVILNFLALIPYIGILFRIDFWLVIAVTVGLWVLLMMKASQGDRYRLPWAGDFAQMHMPGGRPKRG